MQQALPYSCSRRAYPQPRDALIETCCQSDKHICIQSTLYLFSLERSAVCCWLNILNQFAVSELPASSLVPAASSLGDRLAAGGMGQGNRRPLSFNSFQLCPGASLSFSPSPGARFNGPLTRPGSVSWSTHYRQAWVLRAICSSQRSLLSYISEFFATLFSHLNYFFTWYFSLNRLQPDIHTNFSLILSSDVGKTIGWCTGLIFQKCIKKNFFNCPCFT